MIIYLMKNAVHITLLFLIALVAACSSTEPLTDVSENNFRLSDTGADSITAGIPDYSNELNTIKGKGKAIISEPENSQRVTLYFSGNRRKSLITAKNSIGIEGGQLLADDDSLLIYNKVDKYARKISIKDSDLEQINNLASVNLLNILNIPVSAGQVEQVLENEETFLLQLQTGARVYVSKDELRIRQINRPELPDRPYSQIMYDGYTTIKGLSLPRRITIFSADKSTKIELLIQSLQVNPELDELKIDLPEGTKIYRQ